MKTSRNAFTLIELLVVIAIIAILAAILFPVFAQAKKAAKGAVCISNVKQLSLAGFLYMNDYDDTYEPFESNLKQTGAILEQGFWWGAYKLNTSTYTSSAVPQDGLLWPYLKTELYNCPLSPATVNEVGWPDYAIGYGINDEIVYADVIGTDSYGYPIHGPANAGQLDRPAETIFMADSALYTPASSFSAGGYFPQPHLNGPARAVWGVTSGRHNQKASLAWADGHAKIAPVTLRSQNSFNTYPSFTPPYYPLAVKYYVGDVLNPKYPWGSGPTALPSADYYYMLTKPSN